MEDPDESDEFGQNSNSNSTGMDEDGIVNFLEEAIGAEVGTDILREFSHSDAFAELLEVVTSSLIPTTSSSISTRRQSAQESEKKSNVCSQDTTSRVQRGRKELYESGPSTSSKHKTRGKVSNSAKTNVKTKRSKKTSKEIDVSSDQEEELEQSRTRNQISDRLKIRLFSSPIKDKKPAKKSSPNKKKDSSNSKVRSGESPSKGRKKGTQVAATNKCESNLAVIAEVKNSPPKVCEDEDIPNDAECELLRKKFKLKSCSIVMFDVKSLGKLLKDNMCLVRSNLPDISTGTVTLCDEKTNDLELLEALIRQKYLKNSHQAVLFDDKLQETVDPLVTEDSGPETITPVVDENIEEDEDNASSGQQSCASEPASIISEQEEPNQSEDSEEESTRKPDELSKICEMQSGKTDAPPPQDEPKVLQTSIEAVFVYEVDDTKNEEEIAISSKIDVENFEETEIELSKNEEETSMSTTSSKINLENFEGTGIQLNKNEEETTISSKINLENFEETGIQLNKNEEETSMSTTSSKINLENFEGTRIQLNKNEEETTISSITNLENFEETEIQLYKNEEKATISSKINLENIEETEIMFSKVEAESLGEVKEQLNSSIENDVKMVMKLILQQIEEAESGGVFSKGKEDCSQPNWTMSVLQLDPADRIEAKSPADAALVASQVALTQSTLETNAIDPELLEETKAVGDATENPNTGANQLPDDTIIAATKEEELDSYDDHDVSHLSEKDGENESDEGANNLTCAKSKKARPTAFALIDSDTESDSDEEIKLRQSTSSRSRVNDETVSEDSDDAKGRKFGRKRDKDDIRTKKFGKLESERRRKFSDQKKGSRPAFNAEDPFGKGKSLANSFRIPKRQAYQKHRESDDKSKLSTPLAKQELPEVNLKFERCKQGKDGEKEFKKEKHGKHSRKDNEISHTVKSEPQAEGSSLTYGSYKKNKTTGTDSHIADKLQDKKPKKATDKKPVICEQVVAGPREKSKRKRFAIMSGDSDRLPPPPPSPPPSATKVEVESSPLGLDKPDDPGFENDLVESLFGDINDSVSAPLSDLKPGPLAIEVAGLIHKGKVELPALKDSDCPTEGTAQKCAWWFAKNSDNNDSQNLNFKTPSIVFETDAGSELSFCGNISNSDIVECQVNEISSTSRVDTYVAPGGDLDKEECCGRSLLTAKIRDGTSDNFTNIFDLRPGTTYEKENFQAKCNLCNLLIVGRTDLAYHIRGVSHSEKLKGLCEPIMGSPDEEIDANNIKSSTVSESKDAEVKKEKEKLKDTTAKDKDKRIKRERGKDTPDVKKEKRSNETECEMEVGRTSTGLRVKVPIPGTSRKRSRSPVARRRTRSRSKSPALRRRSRSRSPNRSRQRSRSRSLERTRRKSRSPIRRIPRSRSPTDKNKHSRRSRSPVRKGRNTRSRVTTSEEKVKEFLSRTRKSKSPSNGYHSKRSRRSKSRSKSPQIVMKKDNREFHEKLALTAEGKWTAELEQSWKLMEAEEAIFKEQFYDLRKKYVTTPEDHPKYGEEWTTFWEKRYQEVEASGKDPDAHDYVSEWKEFWTKRLNMLLQDEADLRIKEIRRKYGMDFETLSKLRKPEIKPELVETKVPVNNPTPVFIPQHVPSMVPPPSVLSNHSGRASISDNFSAKSMSISDGEIETSKIPAPVPVTIEDFKSNWEAITRTSSKQEDGVTDAHDSKGSRGISGNRSDITSSSVSSNDFGGFDLIQVLRLLSQCEDQLSFLAPKIFEYFKIAEEKELAKRRGSYELLDNLELVTLLSQSKERLVTLIRSNVLSNDSLKSINLAVYALNNIFNDPRCQRTQAQVPPTPATSTQHAVRTEESPSVPNFPDIRQNMLENNNDRGWKDPRMDQTTRLKQKPEQKSLSQVQPIVSEIAKLMSNFSAEQKISIARELANYLITNGRQGMNTTDLIEFVGKLLLPQVKIALKEKQRIKEQEQLKKERLVLVDPFQSEEESPTSTKVYGVTSQRVVGSALPVLPAHAYNLPKSAGVPKLPPGYIANHSNVPPSRITGNGGSSRATDEPDGRTSPFSCRDYSGNPLAEGRL